MESATWKEFNCIIYWIIVLKNLKRNYVKVEHHLRNQVHIICRWRPLSLKCNQSTHFTSKFFSRIVEHIIQLYSFLYTFFIPACFKIVRFHLKTIPMTLNVPDAFSHKVIVATFTYNISLPKGILSAVAIFKYTTLQRQSYRPLRLNRPVHLQR